MDIPAPHSIDKATDNIQRRLTEYACDLGYTSLPPDVIHAAKARIIDTLGTVIGGFFGEPCRIARNVASVVANPDGATVIGTRTKTTPDLAAFVNATAACYPAMADSYHAPGGDQGHANETILPLLAVGEYARVSGREFVTSVVLAYEVFLRFSDVFHNQGFDNTNFGCIATALAAGKLLGLSSDQILHSVSMAVVPNNILRQAKKDVQTMFKAAVVGQAGRAGVFAALLARAGMEGPHLPFEGKAGWCDHVARERFAFKTMGGENGAPFKILKTLIKTRTADGKAIAPIMAAEKLAPLRDIGRVKQITVETYKKARDNVGSDERRVNPASREDAIYSIFYLVAVTLMDGTVTQRSFNDTHLWNSELRALMRKITIVENEEFTKAFAQIPQQQRARITIITGSNERLVAESGGDQDDMSSPKSDSQIEEKFRNLTEDFLGAKQVNTVLQRLWQLEEITNVAEIPPAFVFV